MSGIFPEKLKLIPMFKKGDWSDTSCFQPLLLVFSKILEGVLYDQFIQYLEENNLLYGQ